MATTVRELLEQHELGQYAAAFDEEGWDSLPNLRAILAVDISQLVADTKMKSGHVVRLRVALGLPPASAAPHEPAAPAPPAPAPAAASPPPQQPQPPPPPPMPTDTTKEQSALYEALIRRGPIGELVHGRLIDTYQKPNGGGPAIKMVSPTCVVGSVQRSALYSILYRNSLCNGHYSGAACPRVHCRALQHYSTLQHTTALQLYSVYTLQHSAPPLWVPVPVYRSVDTRSVDAECGVASADCG